MNRISTDTGDFEYTTWFTGDVWPTDPPVETHVPFVWLPSPCPVDYLSVAAHRLWLCWNGMWNYPEEDPPLPPRGYSHLTSLI